MGRYSLRDLFKFVTMMCVLCALCHGSVFYKEPYGALCRLGLLVPAAAFLVSHFWKIGRLPNNRAP
jgi:hypothetical protein